MNTTDFSRLTLSTLPYYFSVPYDQVYQRLDVPFVSVICLNHFGGYGISTVCASATPLGLTLAPGLLRVDEPSP